MPDCSSAGSACHSGPAPIQILELTCDQLTAEFGRRYGKGHYHAAAVYREVFRRPAPDLQAVDALARSPELVDRLAGELDAAPGAVVAEQAEGDLVKLIIRLQDGLDIETVVIPMARHTTVCISCQVGCRMGCRFCETGQMGFYRHLTAAEIVGQVYTARVVRGLAVKNVVFMGMGEPFDNFDNVVQAVRVLSDQRGLSIAPRHITISTAGRIDGIRRLARLNGPRPHLAVSLNASNDLLRSAIMPINRTVPMARLRDALRAYPLSAKDTFLIEYVLIKGVNDRRQHARELAEFLKPLPVRINLIPYNPRAQSPYRPPLPADVDRFRDWLVAEKVFVRLRSTKGRSITAACGQLGRDRGGPPA